MFDPFGHLLNLVDKAFDDVPRPTGDYFDWFPGTRDPRDTELESAARWQEIPEPSLRGVETWFLGEATDAVQMYLFPALMTAWLRGGSDGQVFVTVVSVENNVSPSFLESLTVDQARVIGLFLALYCLEDAAFLPVEESLDRALALWFERVAKARAR